ncbi:MAG: phosphotransferase family protein [Candidatus Thorarchaeota archaeon]
MNELNGYKDEILEQIAKEYPDLRKSRMSEFRQIFGGADTTIYGFDLISDSKSIPLILRIYRPNYSASAKWEYKIMQNLHAEGIQVPKPYLFNEESSTTGRAYFIMERIDGPLLSDELNASRSTPRFDQLLELFVGNLVAIHSVDWTKGFTFVDRYDIAENPHLFFTHELASPKRIIKDHGVDDLIPVIDWMETNQLDLGDPCLLHADYHAMNNLVRNSDEIITIDWANAKLGDCRYDLGFAVMALDSMGFDHREQLVSRYEEISGQKIQNLEYFMVLSALWNLLRIYSCAFDHGIMGESAETAKLFLNDYRPYAVKIVKTTQETTGVSLSKLLDVLEQ